MTCVEIALFFYFPVFGIPHSGFNVIIVPNSIQFLPNRRYLLMESRPLNTIFYLRMGM